MKIPKCPKCKAEGRVTGGDYAKRYDADFICSRCGGTKKGSKWRWICQACKKEVDRLTGLFVPTVCVECEQAEHDRELKNGHVCRMCRKTYGRCCC